MALSVTYFMDNPMIRWKVGKYDSWLKTSKKCKK
jgi:hypothetical protein